MANFSLRAPLGPYVSIKTWTDWPYLPNGGALISSGSPTEPPVWDPTHVPPPLPMPVPGWPSSNQPSLQGAPSRLNPTNGLPHKYLAVIPLGLLVVLATPDGLAEAAPDSLLGGNLFIPNWVETPGRDGPTISQSAGYSSTISTRLTTPGHYLLGVFRQNGGQVMMHVHCEAP